MPLYERLMGLVEPKIPVHQFMGVMQEYALGTMTGAQATAAFGLDAGEQAEATTLLNKILAESTQNGGIARRAKAQEIHLVLCVAETRIPPLDTALAVRTRLGV